MCISPGRQPGAAGTLGAEPAGGMGPDGSVARGRLDLCAVGPVFRRISAAGKAVSGSAAPAAAGAAARLCADGGVVQLCAVRRILPVRRHRRRRGHAGPGGLPLWDGGTLYYLHSYAPVLLAAAVGSTPLPAVLCRRMAAGRAGRVLDALEPIALLALLAVCTAFLVSGSANPFLYFRF